MPKQRSDYVPKYRHHKASGQARVTINGKDYWLGPWRSKASLIEYDRVINEWLANGRQLPSDEGVAALTVVEVVAAFMRHARTHYSHQQSGRHEKDRIADAIKPVKELYGRTPASEFGPKRLKAIRQRMIDAGLSRTYINGQIGCIRRVFNWAASEELIPESVSVSLTTVSGLQKGYTTARETEPVEPVDDAIVDATLPFLSEVVADMVRFQRLTGCRPNEVCQLRPGDVDRSQDVWMYRPMRHKTQHHGKERVIVIGPKAQDILKRYLLRPEWEYCFSPQDSEKRRLFLAHQSRKTPLSCGNRPGTNRKAKPRRSAGKRYQTASYRRAIHRACDKAEVDRWSPNQLRHAAATEVRKLFDLESARTVLGHSEVKTTEIYAGRDIQRAAEIARQIG